MGCSGSKEGDAAGGGISNNARDAPPSSSQGAKPKGGAAYLNPNLMMSTVRPQTEETKNKGHHLRNIFAKPLQDLLQLDTFSPPVHKKTDEENVFIRKALKKNFVFETLGNREMKPLVNAFESWAAAADEVIIKQGDEVGDYFYIIEEGKVKFLVEGEVVGEAGAGGSFGELSLLYTCPRAATVQASGEGAKLFRVDQTTFRYILKQQTEQGQNEKTKLLQGVEFLKDMTDPQIEKLSRVMTPKRFTEGEYLMKKGEAGDYFYILKEGTVKVTDIEAGNAKYEDVTLKPGGYFGERALVTGEPRNANVIAVTDGLAFDIDKKTFEAVLGTYNDLIMRSQDLRRLKAIKMIADSKLEQHTLYSLSRMVKDFSYKKGTALASASKPGLAALYLVREGKIEIVPKVGDKTVVEENGFFGEELLLADRRTTERRCDADKVEAEFTATVVEDCKVGVLTLADVRRVCDTKYLGVKAPAVRDSLMIRSLKPEELERKKILGAGTFGQVWLVSRTDHEGKKIAYALKIQSKYELCKDGQAKAVVYEKKVMSKLNHPFLIGLIAAYQDDDFVYMVMELIQGGELYNVIHTPILDGVSERDAKFYAAGITEGLGYMHRQGFVYRDLKPENVLLNRRGYPVIIDFGFVKYVTSKTYTLCGTPLYLAPEVILNRGHNWGADHWSLGVLIYEMITGGQPFYVEGMEQMDLFRAIAKGKFTIPRGVSKEASSIIEGFLTRDPSQRLGSLAGGEDDILAHSWLVTVDFESLRKQKFKAPLIPKIKNPFDASNFDDWSHLKDKTSMKFPKISRDEAAIFDGF